MSLTSVTDIKTWSGSTNGRFHIDFLGVRTDASFFAGLRPAKVGRLKTSLPQMSDLLVEYAACTLAISASPQGASVLEIGAAWGVWTARCAAIAHLLDIPIRTLAIEPMAGLVDLMQRHYVANGMRSDCHRAITAVAVASAAEHVWFRAESRTDVGGRLVADDWVQRNTANPPISLPAGLSVPSRDGSSVLRLPCVRLKEVMAKDGPFSLVHIRPNGGHSKLIDKNGVTAKRTGVLIAAGLQQADALALDEVLAKENFRSILNLEAGTELSDQRASSKLRHAMRIAAGDLIDEPTRLEMVNSLATLTGQSLSVSG